jgi:FtsH-binding integral membrane protein
MSKLLFILSAVVALALGLALVFAPEATLTQFGTETRVAELHMARFFGAALATLGLLLWFAKDASDENVQRNMGYAMLAGTVLALFVSILGVAVNGVVRNFGWLIIIVEVAFGLGYVFVLFLQPRMK